jgi:hypothetical protein
MLGPVTTLTDSEPEPETDHNTGNEGHQLVQKTTTLQRLHARNPTQENTVVGLCIELASCARSVPEANSQGQGGRGQGQGQGQGQGHGQGCC